MGIYIYYDPRTCRYPDCACRGRTHSHCYGPSGKVYPYETDRERRLRKAAIRWYQDDRLWITIMLLAAIITAVIVVYSHPE